MMGKNRHLKDDLLSCLCLLACGLSTCSSFIPDAVENIFGPVLLVLLVVLLLVTLVGEQQRRNMSPEEKRELERESRDERSLMIQAKAAQICHRAEDWGLILLLTISLFMPERSALFAVLYWIFIIRFCFYFAIRWWLNRKY